MTGSSLPGRSLWVSVGAGVVLSVAAGTLVIIAATQFVDEGTFLGAFLGGLLAGQLVFRPLRRAAFSGALVALLSFMAYFQIVPFLIELAIIRWDIPPPPPDMYWPLFFAALGIFLVLGTAGGLVGGYVKGRLRPPVIPGRCANCGAVAPEEAVFCPYCGKRVKSTQTPSPEW